MIDNNAVLEALRKVKDPRTGDDIVSSKMIEDFRVDGNSIAFTLLLDTPDQRLKSSVNIECIKQIGAVYPDAQVHIHLKKGRQPVGGAPQQASGHGATPPPVSDKVLPQVKNIIAVGSGKGGVGKSTISVNLAVALANEGYKVGLIDADLYGPSLPTMMGLVGRKPNVQMIDGKHKLVPIMAHGVYTISIGLIIDPEQAVVLRGPRLTGLIKQFIHDCVWPELDYLVIDLPPGTGDVQLTLVQTVPVTGAVMVTTPQEVAVIDAVKAQNMFLLPNVNVPIVGVVENMSWFTPAELPDHKYYIFGKGGGEKLARSANSPLLAQIPLIQSVREAGDFGLPAAATEDHPLKSKFREMALGLVVNVKKRNESLDPTHIVEIKHR